MGERERGREGGRKGGREGLKLVDRAGVGVKETYFRMFCNSVTIRSLLGEMPRTTCSDSTKIISKK